MTKQMSRRLLALAGLLAIVGSVVVARLPNAPTSAAATTSRQTRGTTAPKATAVADVKLELLKVTETDLGPTTRNPFQFKTKPVAAAAARPQAVAPTPVVVGPPPPPPGPPPLPAIALKFIGVFETAEGKVGAFRDGGGDIVNGKEGDIIEGRYRLLKIGAESADLAYLDGRGRQTIRLSGQ